jgi:hypothetical protein
MQSQKSQKFRLPFYPLAKVGVAGSNPVFRSRDTKGSGDFPSEPFNFFPPYFLQKF